MLDPGIRDRLESWQAARLAGRGSPDLCDEDLLGLLERGSLELGLAAEMADDPGLAHPEVTGQLAVSHALESLDRGGLDRTIDNRDAGLGGFGIRTAWH